MLSHELCVVWKTPGKEKNYCDLKKEKIYMTTTKKDYLVDCKY